MKTKEINTILLSIVAVAVCGAVFFMDSQYFDTFITTFIIFFLLAMTLFVGIYLILWEPQEYHTHTKIINKKYKK